MNELKSYTEYAVSTPTADFVIGFDFNYGEDAVNVTVNDVPAAEAGYTVVYLNETTIRLSPSVSSGVVRLQRETDIDQSDHAYRAGAKFIAQTMDENFEQLRHSQQEVRDGFSKLASDTYEVIEVLDVTLALAQDAAQDAQDAAVIAQGAADTVNAIIVGGKVSANNVLDASGETQQQVSYNGGSKWHSRVGGYKLNERVVLTNGDIVKSTDDGNMDDPNVDMTWWIKIGNLIIVNTVAELVDKNLKNGDVVKTLGYNNLFDNGGALYVISDTATDYSIPLNNGLHAVFNDDFDIRKFGVRDGIVFNQTAELTRMVAYADSRIYEIDFHGFHITTPETYHFTTTRGAVIKGMGFSYPHNIKNLNIANDKTKNLYSGTCPIHFLPKDVDGSGTFKLTNVIFDPYHSDFTLVSMEMDGFLCGFNVGWHPDATVRPNRMTTVSGYNLEFDNIHFASPAISYNLACAGIFTKNVMARNLTGDYWGIYLVHHTYNLDTKKFHGIFRDDLHAGSGRLLVTNLIHEEAEITDSGVITRGLIDLDDISCFKKSDGFRHVVYKVHRLGTITIKEFRASRCVGSVEMYGGATEINRKRLIVNKFSFKDGDKLSVNLACQLDSALFEGFNENLNYMLNNTYYGTLNIKNIKKMTTPIGVSGAAGTCDVLIVDGIEEIPDAVYGLFRDSGSTIKDITLKNINCDQQKLLECKFEKLTIANLQTDASVVFNNFIFNRSLAGSVNPIVTIKNSNIQGISGPLIDLAIAGSQVTFKNSNLIGGFTFANAAPILTGSSTFKKSIVYDPPSIAANAEVSTTVSIVGATVGAPVNAAFSQYNANIEISAQVSAANIVTVKFKNIGAAAVDLASGTLAVKLI